MEHQQIKEKILKHLDDLNELEDRKVSQSMIDIIAERYGVPRNVVEQVIAEWSAGGKKLKKNDEDIK